MKKTKIKSISQCIAVACGGFLLGAGTLGTLNAQAQTGFNNSVNMPTVNLTGQGGSTNYNTPLDNANNSNTTNNTNNTNSSATTNAVVPQNRVRSRTLPAATSVREAATPVSVSDNTENVQPVEVQRTRPANTNSNTRNTRRITPTPTIVAPNSIQSSTRGITLSAPAPYVQEVKGRYRTLEQERAQQPIPLTPVDVARNMDLVRDMNYQSVPAIMSQSGNTESEYSETGVSFRETKTGQPLAINDIDFDRSFVAIATPEGQDVKLTVVSLLDIQDNTETEKRNTSAARNLQPHTFNPNFNPDSNDAFIYDEATALSKAGQSQKCVSSTLYLTTKNLNNFVYSLNNFDDKKCGRVIMVADNGTLNAKDDRFVNVSVGEQNKQQVVKLDILKDGWSEPQKHLLFGQPALMVLVNQKLDLIVAPQVDKNTYHYAKAGDISYKNYKMASPFTYKASIPKQKTYRAFAVTQGDEKINYYPTTIFVEDLDAQFKLISQ